MEEYIFPTWVLHRHPQLVPNDGRPRDTTTYILSGLRLEVSSSTLRHASEEPGRYFLKRVVAGSLDELTRAHARDANCSEYVARTHRSIADVLRVFCTQPPHVITTRVIRFADARPPNAEPGGATGVAQPVASLFPNRVAGQRHLGDAGRRFGDRRLRGAPPWAPLPALPPALLPNGPPGCLVTCPRPAPSAEEALRRAFARSFDTEQPLPTSSRTLPLGRSAGGPSRPPDGKWSDGGAAPTPASSPALPVSAWSRADDHSDAPAPGSHRGHRGHRGRRRRRLDAGASPPGAGGGSSGSSWAGLTPDEAEAAFARVARAGQDLNRAGIGHSAAALCAHVKRS